MRTLINLKGHFLFLSTLTIFIIFTVFLMSFDGTSDSIDFETLLTYNRSLDSKLGNFSNFQFILNSDVCQSEPEVDILFLIGSHPSHRNLRDIYRQHLVPPPDCTNYVFKVIFTFGYLEDQSEQRHLLDESEMYGDIVQGNFVDSYKTLVLRDLMGFRWAWQRCPQSRYIVRLDDDVVFDIRALVGSLQDNCFGKKAFVGCFYLWQRGEVWRADRYGLTKEEHPEDVFEDYCSGWLYVVTPLMAYLLDTATEHVRYYWLNDAYITGSLVNHLSFNHTDLKLSFTFQQEDMIGMMKEDTLAYSIGTTGADADLAVALFNYYRKHNQYIIVK